MRSKKILLEPDSKNNIVCFSTHSRHGHSINKFTLQIATIAWMTFLSIIRSRLGIVTLAAIILLTFIFTSQFLELQGLPLYPRTSYLLTLLSSPINTFKTPWVIMPLFIIFCAGELIWQEREDGVNEIVNTTPVLEFIFLIAKFFGLALVLIMWQIILIFIGLFVQISLGYHNFEIEVYLKVLLFLKLIDYLILAVFALVVHVIVNQKYIGHLVAILFYGTIIFASKVGIEHNLLIYGGDPGWDYSDMRGLDPFIAPWLWFKTYWILWAILLTIFASLFWVRGTEVGVLTRIHHALQRFKRTNIWFSGVPFVALLLVGGIILYNTNYLNKYTSIAEVTQYRAEYEQKYSQYTNSLKPRLLETKLQIEFYPEKYAVEVKGTYMIVNDHLEFLDSLHFSPALGMETEIKITQNHTKVLLDEELKYYIFKLASPLKHGDSIEIDFVVKSKPQGFENNGVNTFLVCNGSYLTSETFLPTLGYLPSRQIKNEQDRRAYGLSRFEPFTGLFEKVKQNSNFNQDKVYFEAIIGTSSDQTAVAPGILKSSWKDKNRNYFHYVAEQPIWNEFALFSAQYRTIQSKWKNVSINIFYHPGHEANLDRMLRSVHASLDYYTNNYASYPFSSLNLVQRPGLHGMVAKPGMIIFQEGYSLFNPQEDLENFDFPFVVVAHEIAHQYWNSYTAYSNVEGIGLLSESLAEYSAMQVLEYTYGKKHLERYLKHIRNKLEGSRPQINTSLLRANNDFLAYYKGPLALYAIDQYVGRDRINQALRSMHKTQGSKGIHLLTTLDLYRELKEVTPDSLHYLMHDLFEKNTYWELETVKVSAKQNGDGLWEVEIEIQANKIVLDEKGGKAVIPMEDWIEVGVYAESDKGEVMDKTLHLKKHIIKSGKQLITVLVESRPTHAGIDPNNLMISNKKEDNIKLVNLFN